MVTQAGRHAGGKQQNEERIVSDTGVIDVLIVGAGPTGATLAIDLLRRGLAVRIIDKAAASFEGSRAKGVQPRSLEVFEDLGAVDEVLKGGGAYPLLGIHLGPLVVPWRMIAARPRTDDVPFPSTLLIPQSRTDRALLNRLHSLGCSVEYNKELLDLAQDREMVVAQVAGPGGPEAITARYLVGADGGASAVRGSLQINFAGTTDEADRMIIVDAATTGLSRNRWHVWPGPAGQFVGACPLPHSELFQWMIRLAPDEKPDLEPAALNQRIQARVRNRRVELHDIHWISVFRPNIRMAEHYRRDRVFLAGDAAHVHTPAGAQGLNTGVQDAYNLGWKLAQVLAGADPRLLDTYEAERAPIAAAVLALSTRKYLGIAKLDPSSIRRGKDETQLSLTYRGGPLAPDSADRTARLKVGDRAPDAILTAAGGEKIRLFDIYRGPHFTAIAYGDPAARELEGLDWPSTGAPLRRVFVDAGNARSADQSHLDPRRTFRRGYGLTGPTLLLIRPDGYLGNIATRDMLAATQAVIRNLVPASAPIR